MDDFDGRFAARAIGSYVAVGSGLAFLFVFVEWPIVVLQLVLGGLGVVLVVATYRHHRP